MIVLFTVNFINSIKTEQYETENLPKLWYAYAH